MRNREIGQFANTELGIRKGAVIGKAFLYKNTNSGFVSSAILDKEADIRIEGNYRDRQNAVCPNCFCRKTSRGDCNC
jgi:hypothetical protein